MTLSAVSVNCFSVCALRSHLVSLSAITLMSLRQWVPLVSILSISFAT